MSILELTGAESCKECGERAQAERDRLQAENAKLRELVRDMHRAICCLVVLGDDYAGEHEDELCALDDRMRELGVDA